MPDADSLIAPASYAWWWLAIAILVLLLVAAWYFFVFYSTRHKDAPEEAEWKMDDRSDPYSGPRGPFLRSIDEVAARHHAGELSVRAAHLELASVLRAYAKKSRGFPADVATLSDLQKRPDAGPLVDAISGYYAPEFSTDSSGSVDAACDSARAVVKGW